MPYLEKNIVAVEPYKIELLFNNGEIKTVDFFEKLSDWSKTENSIFKQLLDKSYFMQVRLDSDLETICWDNGIDFCPDSLYLWATGNEKAIRA